MKIPIRSQAQLQRQIDRYVRRIEYAGRLFGHQSKRTPLFGNPSVPSIYNAIAQAGAPIDYCAITEALGLPCEPLAHLRVQGRISYLEKGGYIKYAGRKHSDYFVDGIGARLYVAVPKDEIPAIQRRVQRAVGKLLHDIRNIERTAYFANDVPACVAATAHPVGERNAEVVQLRTQGMSLIDIGRKFGFSRERARQIVDRSMRPRKPPKTKPFGWPLDYVRKTPIRPTGRPVGRPRKRVTTPAQERTVMLDVAGAIIKKLTE